LFSIRRQIPSAIWNLMERLLTEHFGTRSSQNLHFENVSWWIERQGILGGVGQEN
jgi:hypothetical protein